MTKEVKSEEKKIPESVLLPSLSRRKATQNKKYVEDEEEEVKMKSELSSSSVRKPTQKKKHIEEVDEKEKNKIDFISVSSKKAPKQKKYTEEDEGNEQISTAPTSSSSRRRANTQPEFKDEMVTCPECDFQCLHSKIVQHLKRCTKKMAQTKKLKDAVKPNKPQKTDKVPTTATQSENKTSDPEGKKPKQSDIVKKAFQKKFEAQQKMEYFSDSDAEMNLSWKETQESDQDKEDKQPSLKLKFSRKDSGSDLSHFEVSNDNIRNEFDEKKSPKDDELGPDTSLSAILRNINADKSDPKQPKPPLLKSSVIPQISPPKIGAKPDKQDDSSDDEVVPQKSFRLHSFIESLRAMHARLPQRKEDPPKPPPAPEPSESPPKPSSSVESANLKNKWLQSLEDRSKVKPAEPSPAVNKIQSEIAQMKNKESLIYNKAKLKAYPETPVKTSSLKETVSPHAHVNEEKSTRPEPLKRKKKAATFDDDEDEFPAKAKRKSVNPKSGNKDQQKEEYHDGRPSLRKGNKLIPCPICGAEYAIADNLQKHIDKDHFGETDRVFLKRVKPKSESKEKEKAEPMKKKKKGSSSLTTFDDEEEDEFLGDSRPSLDTSTAEEKFDSLMASVSTSYKGKKVAIHENEDEDEEEESTKLTEYEIFQKLQLKESSKTEKKRVECSECGKMLPVNTIKRHLLKHEKDALMEKEGSATAVEEAPVKSKPQPKPRGRKKNNSGTRNRKQEPKHLKKEEEEKKSESIKGHDEDDERIQCPLNLKKMIMKRHLMKPEADTEDTVKHEKKVEEKDETDGVKPPAASKGRKKKLASSPSVAKRQIERQTKTKKKAMDDPEMYAPIEITPTKEYWEYEKEKREKSFDFPSADDNDLGPSKKLRKGSDLEIRNKSLQDLKDAEKSRNTSEEESESENSLDAAVRKVVSYRMTPKQALSHYNLTPKVIVSHHNVSS